MGRHKRLKCEDILRQIREFAKETGRPPKVHEKGFHDVVYVAKREFGSWKHALRIAGLQTYAAWKRKKSLVGKIRMLLNYNPMTMKELREELSKSSKLVVSDLTSRIGAAIGQASDIRSIGPRRSKVYYLEGQETLAQTRLNAVFSKIPKLEEKIFYHLRQPMTKAQIEKLVSDGEPTAHRKAKIGQYLNELVLAGLVYKVKFMAGKGRGHARRFRSFELFGNLAGKTYYCRFDCPNEVVKLVIANLPRQELDNPSFRKVLMRHLKTILPEVVALSVLGELP